MARRVLRTSRLDLIMKGVRIFSTPLWYANDTLAPTRTSILVCFEDELSRKLLFLLPLSLIAMYSTKTGFLIAVYILLAGKIWRRKFAFANRRACKNGFWRFVRLSDSFCSSLLFAPPSSGTKNVRILSQIDFSQLSFGKQNNLRAKKICNFIALIFAPSKLQNLANERKEKDCDRHERMGKENAFRAVIFWVESKNIRYFFQRPLSLSFSKYCNEYRHSARYE